MKANKAPEKIYLNWVNYPLEEIQVEYTRTDAFIEKACKWLKENKNRYVYNKGGHDNYIPTCSNQIIEDFKKYMKGE